MVAALIPGSKASPSSSSRPPSLLLNLCSRPAAFSSPSSSSCLPMGSRGQPRPLAVRVGCVGQLVRLGDRMVSPPANDVDELPQRQSCDRSYQHRPRASTRATLCRPLGCQFLLEPPTWRLGGARAREGRPMEIASEPPASASRLGCSGGRRPALLRSRLTHLEQLDAGAARRLAAGEGAAVMGAGGMWRGRACARGRRRRRAVAVLEPRPSGALKA